MNILYGVPGEGMGHATRSKVIIDHLLQQGHNLLVVSSSRAFVFLEKKFPGRVHEIKGFHFAYKNAAVSKSGTLMMNLKHLAGNLKHNLSSYFKLDKSFHPDLVITDFESFSYYWAKYQGIPVISIDNMQVMDRCKLDITIPGKERDNFSLAKNIVNAKVPGCKHYFISSFFEAQLKKKNSEIVPPIIREEILEAKPGQGDHVVVYQTAGASPALLSALKSVPDINFKVYGAKTPGRIGNVELMAFSETGFIDDIASAYAIVANGGYSFISEAVYLGKPVFSVPVANQFEQFMNAAYIEKLGYGRHFNEVTPDSLKAFLYDAPRFRKNLSGYSQKKNDVLLSRLDAYIQSIQ